MDYWTFGVGFPGGFIPKDDLYFNGAVLYRTRF